MSEQVKAPAPTKPAVSEAQKIAEERDALKLELEQTKKQLSAAVPESGFGMTWHMVDSNGVSVQLIARCPLYGDWKRMVASRTAMQAELIKDGWSVPPKVERAQQQAQAGTDEATPVCAIHNKPMTLVNGQKGKFWSCHEKLADGSYCPYKPKK